MLSSVRWFLIGFLAIVLVASCSQAIAHEMVPTYPKLERSHIQGILKSKLLLFNKRQDVEYYEIGVFDNDWNPVSFVTSYKIIKLEYLGTTTVEIYIKEEDKERATYVCSKSKLKRVDDTRTAISSKICSRFK